MGKNQPVPLIFPICIASTTSIAVGLHCASKNEVNRLDSIAPEPIELPPFSADEVARIDARCAAIQNRFKALGHGAGD